MNWLKRLKLAASILKGANKGELADLIETNINVLTAEQYKDLSIWWAHRSNIGHLFTDLKTRLTEYNKKKDGDSKEALNQSWLNLYQCIFNLENGINHSIEGLKVIKKKA